MKQQCSLSDILLLRYTRLGHEVQTTIEAYSIVKYLQNQCFDIHTKDPKDTVKCVLASGDEG